MAIETLKWRPRGPVGFAPRVITADGRAGPGAFKFLTCVDELTLTNNLTYSEHKSKCSALDALDYKRPKEITSDLAITFSDFVTEAMAVALLADTLAADVLPVPVTGEEVPIVVDGDMTQLGGPDPATTITSLTFTDSDTTPATPVLGTNYTLDAVYGMITWLDVAGFTQPFVAAYSKKNPLTLAGLKAAPIERWITFQGFNTGNDNELVKVDMFRASFSPSSLQFLPDDIGTLAVPASLLIDTTRPTTDPLGQYYGVGLAGR